MSLLSLKGVINKPFRNSEGYIIHPGHFSQLFTVQEKELALQVASAWDQRGWMPLLILQDANGTCRNLYNYATRARRRVA